MTSSSSPSDTTSRSILVGYAGEGQGAGPVFVTQRAGLFEEAGLDVEIRLLGGARGVVRGLLSGEIAFGNLAAPALVHAALDGADLVYLTGGINQQFLVGRPGVSGLEELRDGRISVGEPGQLGELLTLFLISQMEAHGIGGLTPVYGDDSRDRVTGLLEGRFDAAPISPPVAVEARRQGCPFLLDFAEYGLNFTLGGVATTSERINQDPDLVRKFVRAYVAGMHRYKTDRALVQQIQAEYSRLTDPTVAEETYDLTEAGFPRAPYPVTSGLRIVLDVLARNDPRAAQFDVSNLVDDRFVRELDQRGFIAGLYGER